MTNENMALLKKALFESTLQEIKEIEAIGLPDFSISEEFKAKIYNSHIKKRAPLSKRIIISVIVAVITCTIIMMSISAIRNPIIDFIVETFEGLTTFTVNDDVKDNSPKKIEVVYSPLQSMLERGYNLEYHEVAPMYITYTLKDKNGTEFSLDQLTISGNTAIKYSEGIFEEFYIDKQKAYRLIEEKNTIVIWTYANYKFILTCDSSIDWEEIELIIRETIYSTPVPVSEWGK